MSDVRRSRRRTGGRDWSLSTDASDATVIVETFMVDSWHDHLEQHQIRRSAEDLEASARVRALVGAPLEV